MPYEMIKHRYCKIFMLIFSATLTLPLSAEDREQSVCGGLKERFLFWIWSSITPEPTPAKVLQNNKILEVEFVTADQKTLRGYKYLAHHADGRTVSPKGYLLLALGNAMISDQAIEYLAGFAIKGYDVYVYDYRGYGRSEGKRRINAIIEDYKELISDLNGKYERKMIYGISFGGLVVLNALGSGLDFDSIVIDSSPSIVSDQGCPKSIDPINHVTKEMGQRLLVITGQKDSVLRPEKTMSLREKAAELGAKTVDRADFHHPFQDPTLELSGERMLITLKHLLQENPNE